MNTDISKKRHALHLCFALFIIQVYFMGDALLAVGANNNDPTEKNHQLVNGIIECSGKIRMRNRYTVFLEPHEHVVEYFVENGNKVNKGDPLVNLKNDYLMDQQIMLQEKLIGLQNEQHSIELIEIKIDEKEKAAQRIRALINEEKSINTDAPFYSIEKAIKELIEEVHTNESELRILRKELELIKKLAPGRILLINHVKNKLRFIQEQLNTMVITAPFAGTITKISPYFRGLDPSQPVLEIYDTTPFEVEVQAWQYHLQYLISGCRVKVYPYLYENKFVRGTLRGIGPEAVPTKDNAFPFFPVFIDLDENFEQMRPGMVVKVEIQTASPGEKISR